MIYQKESPENESLRFFGKMNASISHELRNALAVINENAGLIKDLMIMTEKGHPLDKAGAYGIQEWIGLTAVEEIRGSYTNVVGLPTQLVYKTLRDMGFPFD